MGGKNFAGVTEEVLQRRLGHPGYIDKSLQNECYEQIDCKIKRCISCLQSKQTN